MSLLEALPGIPTPVSDVTRALAQLWQGDAGAHAPSEFRASQMNLILHFGLKTEKEEAIKTFTSALHFSQRYPCRIIVLCPTSELPNSEAVLEGKLYSQCFIGEGKGEMCCCEALMLGYRTNASRFLEDQVSIWLESDLPTYHWFHRVPAERIAEQYLSFTKNCRRVVYDSGVDGYGLQSLAWPRPESLRDLAWARTLPIRQSLGQYLSSLAPELLIDGLQEITITYQAGQKGEAENLLCWFFGCLRRCRKDWSQVQPFRWSTHQDDSPQALRLLVQWKYDRDKHFAFRLENAEGEASISANWLGEEQRQPLQIKFLKPEEALAESLFF